MTSQYEENISSHVKICERKHSFWTGLFQFVLSTFVTKYPLLLIHETFSNEGHGISEYHVFADNQKEV